MYGLGRQRVVRAHKCRDWLPSSVNIGNPDVPVAVPDERLPQAVPFVRGRGEYFKTMQACSAFSRVWIAAVKADLEPCPAQVARAHGAEHGVLVVGMVSMQHPLRPSRGAHGEVGIRVDDGRAEDVSLECQSRPDVRDQQVDGQASQGTCIVLGGHPWFTDTKFHGTSHDAGLRRRGRQRASNGLELRSPAEGPASLAGRSLREAARRKQATLPYSTARRLAGQAAIKAQPAGSVAKRPVKGFCELLARPRCRSSNCHAVLT